MVGKIPSRWPGVLALAAMAGAIAAGCVPEGPSTMDGGAPPKPVAAPTTRTTATARPVAATVTSAGALLAQPAAPLAPVIAAAWEDTFDRSELGADWLSLSPTWKITKGRLCGRGARNKGVWLQRRLPVNARVEFDAFAESAEGDIKAELWGDGVSGATSSSYTNATSYLAILGGWKNTKHVLARLNEHGEDRLEIDVDPHSDDERMRAIATGQAYHFKVERADGKKVEWSVNGVVYFTLADREPLSGAGHEHLGLNDWEAPVCFDNLKITPL